MVGYKINSKKSVTLFHKNDKGVENENLEISWFTIATDIKYLGVTLNKQLKDMYDKNLSP